MAVVKYLDALRRGLKVEGFGDIFQQPALIITFGDMARQRFARILPGHIHKRLLVAALRAVQGNLAAARKDSASAKSCGAGHFFTDQNKRRCGSVVVKLPDKGFQNFSGASVAIMAREISLIAEVLTGAEKEYLNAGRPPDWQWL